MCGPKDYGLFAVLVRNGVSISTIFVSNRVWLLLSGLELCMFFVEEAILPNQSI